MIIVDVEIKKAILGRGEEPLPGVEYCDGWRDFISMGIACVCTFDLRTRLSRVFLEEDLQGLQAYLSQHATGGFNTRRFDNQLLAAHGVQVADLHYDMLEQIWVALGLNPDRFVPKTHGGWSLDAVAGNTLGQQKSGNGALAPVWWQQGQRGRVIDYCLRDVWLEAQLLSHIVNGSPVTNGRQNLKLQVPREILEACQ
jgi:hypothetical protein